LFKWLKITELFWLAALLVALICVPGGSIAAPGDILFSDNFSRNNLAPWTTSNPAVSGILVGGQTSGSPPRAAYTSNQAVAVASPAFNAAVPSARLTIWIRRGDDAFSEDPDGGEDFLLEYQRADSSWGPLSNYFGSGTPGQIYQDSFVLPLDALHAALSVRLRQTGGSGFDFDYWHFDDVVVTELAPAGPLAVGTCDYVENGLTNWTINQTSGFAGISSATSLSPTNSLFLNGGVVEVVSSVVDTGDPTFGDMTLWIRRGADSFSEDPDGGEDLVVEYLDDVGSWVALETFTGNGGPGTIFLRAYDLPATARHAGFQLRFRQTGGSGAAWDFWHVDDVCFEFSTDPVLLVSKISQVLSDPINGPTDPKAIPGAIVLYTLGVTNIGLGTVDNDSLVITDVLPANTALFVDTGGGDPITFVDGPVASGLSYAYATDVVFSNQPGGGAPFNFTPIPDAQGFDPAVTGIQVNPTGVMNAAAGGNNPSFNLLIRIRVE
jgi:uncharacterized repeat protein (TIGR01451 family)